MQGSLMWSLFQIFFLMYSYIKIVTESAKTALICTSNYINIDCSYSLVTRFVKGGLVHTPSQYTDFTTT